MAKAVEEQGFRSQAAGGDGREDAGETAADYGHIHVVGDGDLLLWFGYVAEWLFFGHCGVSFGCAAQRLEVLGCTSD